MDGRRCDLKRKLLEEYSAEVRKFSKALTASINALDSREYRRLYSVAESSRALSELARAVYQRHTRTHRC